MTKRRAAANRHSFGILALNGTEGSLLADSILEVSIWNKVNRQKLKEGVINSIFGYVFFLFHKSEAVHNRVIVGIHPIHWVFDHPPNVHPPRNLFR